MKLKIKYFKYRKRYTSKGNKIIKFRRISKKERDKLRIESYKYIL